MTRRIDTMIVGAEKAGTTSLLRYLSEHPDVTSHEAMEMPFFVDDKIYERGWEKSYKEYFPNEQGNKILLAKSVGCMYWEHVPERLFAHNPDLKLIVVLRSPVERAYSAYWFARQMGRENKNTFEEAILAEKGRLETGEDFHLRYHAYLRRGLYGQQLERLSKHFNNAQIKIVIFEEFKKNPESVVDDLFHFLNLNSTQVNLQVRHNETSGEHNKILTWLGYLSPVVRKRMGNFISSSSKRKLKLLLMKTGGKKERIPPINKQTKTRLQNYFKDDAVLYQQLTKQANKANDVLP